MKWIVFTCVYR